jgi:hypothetical protein
MANRASLDPEARVLYGESLAAPSGYAFDAAVATTFIRSISRRPWPRP